MIEYIINNFSKIAISVLLIAFGSWVSWRQWNKIRLSMACDKYDSSIHQALKGVFPNTNIWGSDINKRLKGSISAIELAVTKFKRFNKRKADIETALQNYKDCCYETTYEKSAAYILYPTKGEISPKENFTNTVNALLEFAKKP